MNAVILAGGKGTRLYPMTEQLPKPVIPFFNRPLMDYTLELLKQHNFHDIGVTVRFMPQKIKETIGDGTEKNISIRYFEEDEPLGTAGCVKAIENELDDTFLVISGDALCNIDLSEALAFHQEKQADVTMILSHQNKPREFGLVQTDENGFITGFCEKPEWENVVSDTSNTGIYLINKSVLREIPSQVFFDFAKDLFPLLLKKGYRLFGFISNAYWCDLGTPEKYLQAHFDMLDGKTGSDKTECRTEENVLISEQVTLIPPVYIGANTVIDGTSQIGPYAVIGPDAFLKDVKVEHSVLWQGVRADSTNFSFSVVGTNSKINKAILGGNNRIGSFVSVEENAEIKSGVSLYNNITVKRDQTVESDISSSLVTENDLFQNGILCGVWGNDILPQTLQGIVSSFPAEEILIAYEDASAQSIAMLMASLYAMTGCSVSVAEAHETACRFHAALFHKKAIRIKKTDTALSIQLLDDAGRNISSADERKIRFEGTVKPAAKAGEIKRLHYLNRDFTFYLNRLFPVSAKYVYLLTDEPYPVHSIYQVNELEKYKNRDILIHAVNGTVQGIWLHGELLPPAAYLRLKTDLSAYFGATEVFLPHYAPEKITDSAKKNECHVLYTEQHRGNTMQKIPSFRDFAALLNFEPTFFALALADYVSSGNKIGEENTKIVRYDFSCRPGETCKIIRILNKDNHPEKIVATRNEGIITTIPHNNGYSFTVYGTFATEEYGESFLKDFVSSTGATES